MKEFREFLSYDPATGLFTWTRKPNSHSPKPAVGDIAGSPNAAGYWTIRFRRKLYYAHRLAWFFVYGEWPSGSLDHRNGIKSDNRITNLRLATTQQNSANARGKRNSQSGFKGVERLKTCARFSAYIVVNRRKRHIGNFGSAEEAAIAYDRAAVEHFGEYARTNFVA